jgi:hypothetical protein
MHELMMSPYGSARTVTRLIPIIERLKQRFSEKCGQRVVLRPAIRSASG